MCAHGGFLKAFIFLSLVAFAYPQTSHSCGGISSDIAGGEVVYLSFVDTEINRTTRVGDDDGMFSVYTLLNYCGKIQKKESKVLDCWGTVSTPMQNAFAQLIHEFGPKTEAKINATDWPQAKKDEAMKLAKAKVDYWQGMLQRSRSGMSLLAARSILKSEYFRMGMGHTYRISEEAPGQPRRESKAKMSDLVSRFNFTSDGIPSTLVSRCGGAEQKQDISQFSRISSNRGSTPEVMPATR